MIAVKLEYRYTENHIKQSFIDTGETLTHGQIAIDIDPTALSRNAREAIALGLHKYNYDRVGRFDGTPSIAQLNEALEVMLAKHNEKKAVEDKREADRMLEVHKEAAALSAEVERLSQLSDADLMKATITIPTRSVVVEAAGVDVSRALESLKHKRAALIEARLAAEKAAKEQERIDWIEAHGSDRLKRATQKGHDCTRLYAEERAAMEYPEFHLDYSDDAEWSSRSCPSLAALDESDRFEGSEIVWVKQRHDFDPETWSQDYEGEEAIVIRGFLGKYDLIKYLGDPQSL